METVMVIGLYRVYNRVYVGCSFEDLREARLAGF